MTPIALSRRRLLAAAVATGVAGSLGGTRASAAQPRITLPRITLPRPTGPHPVGVVSRRLVDRRRELMASVWYPAGPGARHCPVAPWMAAEPLRGLLEGSGFDPDVVPAPLTAGHEGAPVLRTRERLPVLVYSHGSNGHRSEATVVVQELASHGYVVAAVDHTDDAYSELGSPTEESFTPWDAARDDRFLLGRVEGIVAGLGAAADMGRVGMLGFSKGATATALVMNTDRRVRAGLSLDGPMQSQPPAGDVDRPFMMMTAEFSRAAEPSVEDFWARLRGWRLNVRADGAVHGSYVDNPVLLSQLARITGMSDEELTDWIGTLPPARAVRIQQAYPVAFFDRHLRHRGHLLDGPSRAFPEVRFLP